MSDAGSNYDRDMYQQVVEELKDQRRLLTTIEVNLGLMMEQGKQQLEFNKASQAFTRELTDFKSTVDRRISDIEKRDSHQETVKVARREEARFRMTLVAVLLGGGLLQVILSHFWR